MGVDEADEQKLCRDYRNKNAFLQMSRAENRDFRGSLSTTGKDGDGGDGLVVKPLVQGACGQRSKKLSPQLKMEP